MRTQWRSVVRSRALDQKEATWPPPSSPSTSTSSTQFVFRAVEEVGATLNAALVVMGDKLGLYRAMAGAGR